MSDEKKDAVIQRGTPRKREDVSQNPEWLTERIANLEQKKAEHAKRGVLIDNEIATRKEQLANLQDGGDAEKEA